MNLTSVQICIIPAAGKGSRWAPISGYLPKEMLPLIDRPVIEWVIEEVIASGCKQIIIVINHQKNIIKKYITKNNHFKKGVKIHFVYQNKPLGIAHAIYMCKTLIGEKPFAVALPDLPTIAHKPILKQLMQKFELIKGEAHLISFDSFPPNTLHLYGECLTKMEKNNLLKIIHLCPQPSESNQSHHPGNKLRVSGRYIFRPEIFSTIKNLVDKLDKNEVNDGDILEIILSKKKQIFGVKIIGHTYNTGNPICYIRANTAFFKKKLTT